MKAHLTAVMTAAALTLGSLSTAQAVEVQGAKIEDTATVAGKTLVLNGAGARIKAVFKIYAIGLYLTEKKTNAADVRALNGPKRVNIVCLRARASEGFGSAFLADINKNPDKDDKTKYVKQSTNCSDL